MMQELISAVCSVPVLTGAERGKRAGEGILVTSVV
jgi:hypothetical protein